MKAISKPDLGLHVLLEHGCKVCSPAVMWLLQLQAIVLAPNKALPHVAACISMGRLAVFSDNKTKVRCPADTLTAPLLLRSHRRTVSLLMYLRGELRGNVPNSRALSAVIGSPDTMRRRTE